MDCGLVSHALSAAMRTLLKVGSLALLLMNQEYLVLVAQLENLHLLSELTLQKMSFFVQPTLETLRHIDDLVRGIDAASRDRGGALLNIIYARLLDVGGASDVLQKLFLFLLEAAAQPFLAQLEAWLYSGTVDDPFLEFMIETTNSSNFWASRFRLIAERAPNFLGDVHLFQKILVCGKNLSVLRECGEASRLPERTKVPFSTSAHMWPPTL
jgi:gamma-tubulin complex component 2